MRFERPAAPRAMTGRKGRKGGKDKVEKGGLALEGTTHLRCNGEEGRGNPFKERNPGLPESFALLGFQSHCDLLLTWNGELDFYFFFLPKVAAA